MAIMRSAFLFAFPGLHLAFLLFPKESHTLVVELSQGCCHLLLLAFEFGKSRIFVEWRTRRRGCLSRGLRCRRNVRAVEDEHRFLCWPVILVIRIWGGVAGYSSCLMLYVVLDSVPANAVFPSQHHWTVVVTEDNFPSSEIILARLGRPTDRHHWHP